MASASTISALQKMFKTVYLGRNLANQSKRKTPAYDKVPSKYDDFDGNLLEFPFNQDMPVGVSPSFAKAKTNASSSAFDRWQMTTRKKLYGFLTIDGEAMRASRKDIGAWLRVRQKETNEIRDYMKMVLGGHAFWGDGAGDLAQVSAVAGGPPVTSITLVNKRDAVKFHKGQRLQGNPNRTGNAGTLRDAIYRVDGINRGTGVLTVVRISGAADVAANDYLYLDGAYDAFPLGVRAFLPSVDPGTGGVPAALLGMTRTDDVTMKSGFRVSWQGSIAETAKLLCADMGQYFDSQDSAIWMSRYNWFRLEQEMESAGRVVRDQSAPARFGSSGIVLQTPEGDITCVSDPYAPADAFYLLNSSTWETHHLDPLIHVIDDDGLAAIRQTDDDGIEIRLRHWGENICQRPFMNGRGEIV
jgi:hypothetical protein